MPPTDREVLSHLAESLAVIARAIDECAATSRESILSVADIAARLQRDPSTIRRWIAHPEHPLPAWRPPTGGDTLIKWGDLLDWLEPVVEKTRVDSEVATVMSRLAK